MNKIELIAKLTRIDQDVFYADPDVNSMCQAYAQSMPYNFEDRLQKVDLETLAIDYFIPSPEDLAVMKLYRWEEPDIQDLTSSAFLQKVDWELLEKLVYDPNEAEGSRSASPDEDRELKQMRFNFEEYKRMWKQ